MDDHVVFKSVACGSVCCFIVSGCFQRRKKKIKKRARFFLPSVYIVLMKLRARHTLALDTNGFCFTWGQGPALGLAHVTLAPSPQRITAIMEVHVRAIVAGSVHSLALGVPRGGTTVGAAWNHTEQSDRRTIKGC
jgi:alpha-tubulin suppressor-like RCC1 family protein